MDKIIVTKGDSIKSFEWSICKAEDNIHRRICIQELKGIMNCDDQFAVLCAFELIEFCLVTNHAVIIDGGVNMAQLREFIRDINKLYQKKVKIETKKF